MVDDMMRALFIISVALYSVAVAAEDLPDPTRPPAFLMATGAGSGTGTTPVQWSSVRPSSGLQTTIISASRRAAIIDGKTVELGEQHGNEQLIEVNEGSVVLRGAQTRRMLTLFSNVKMTPREIKIKQASPESGVQPDEISTTPDAQHERPMSGHPKEKK